MSALLQVEAVTRRFGGIVALDGCTLDVHAREIVGLIGPNGAGKTTLFDVVSGRLEADGGRIRLDGREITNAPPHLIAGMGLSRTLQECRLFFRLTCLENLRLAAQEKGLLPNLATLLVGRRPLASDREARARELLDLVGLEAFAEVPAQHLSFGQKRLLELACALMTHPVMLLLDEPTSGVNPVVVARISGVIRGLRDRGLTLVIVEHNIGFVAALADRVVVLHEGRVLEEGPPEQIQRSPRVIDAYLGDVPADR